MTFSRREYYENKPNKAIELIEDIEKLEKCLIEEKEKVRLLREKLTFIHEIKPYLNHNVDTCQYCEALRVTA